MERRDVAVVRFLADQKSGGVEGRRVPSDGQDFTRAIVKITLQLPGGVDLHVRCSGSNNDLGMGERLRGSSAVGERQESEDERERENEDNGPDEFR